MKTSAGVPSGLVRIGIMPSLSDPSMSILLSRVRARFPAIHLCVFEGSGGQIDEWLVSGRVDFADLLRHIGWITWEELHSPELPRGARGLLPGAVPVAR